MIRILGDLLICREGRLIRRQVVALGALTFGWAFLGGAGLSGPVRGAHGEAAPLARSLTVALPPVLGVQRTVRLLATSTARHPQVVRILFYGQSITEGTWWQVVSDALRRRYPHADLVIENRALGGFSSQLLVKTAETDLYPFHPDLLVFHVFGAHDKYEDIIRRVRERTTAEILLQTDHVTDDAAFSEETNPGKLGPGDDNWSAFMNHRWIPSLATNYQAGLCDQRAAWKLYLHAHHLPPAALLRDQVHLNADGERLMAACVICACAGIHAARLSRRELGRHLRRRRGRRDRSETGRCIWPSAETVWMWSSPVASTSAGPARRRLGPASPDRAD